MGGRCVARGKQRCFGGHKPGLPRDQLDQVWSPGDRDTYLGFKSAGPKRVLRESCMEGEGLDEARNWKQDVAPGSRFRNLGAGWSLPSGKGGGGDGVSWEHLLRDTLTSGDVREGARGFAPKRLPQSKVLSFLPLPRRLRRPSNAPVPEASMGYAVR